MERMKKHKAHGLLPDEHFKHWLRLKSGSSRKRTREDLEREEPEDDGEGEETEGRGKGKGKGKETEGGEEDGSNKKQKVGK